MLTFSTVLHLVEVLTPHSLQEVLLQEVMEEVIEATVFTEKSL